MDAVGDRPDVSPYLKSGTPVPKAYVEAHLEAMGETWRRDSYSLYEPEPSRRRVGKGDRP